MKMIRSSFILLVLMLVSLLASAQGSVHRVWVVMYKQIGPTEGPATTKVLVMPNDKLRWKFGDGWDCAFREEEGPEHQRSLMCRQCPSCGVLDLRLTCGHDVAFQLAETGQDGKVVRLSAVTAVCSE
jgi:hypothetical protein